MKILVVDDNYSYLKLLRTFFFTSEIDAHIATNAKDALAAMKELSFDLLLTDMNLPDIDVMELAAIVKENDKDMPILMMMTSYPTADMAAKAANAGISKVFDKCTSLSEIEHIVREHARERHVS